jgi:hypothetical protein
MFGATSFANAIKPKPFDGSNFKRWRELATLWLTAMNVMYVTTEKCNTPCFCSLSNCAHNPLNHLYKSP